MKDSWGHYHANIAVTAHCSCVTVAVANHRFCHASRDNLDRWRGADKLQQRIDAGTRGGVETTFILGGATAKEARLQITQIKQQIMTISVF